MNNNLPNHSKVRFLFDPTCPWAYRASLWIREVAEILPLDIEWELFSLEYINRGQSDARQLQQNRQALRLLARAGEIEGQAGIDALYLELGRARHERKETLSDEGVLARALATVGLPIALLAETRAAPELDAQLEKSYAAAVAARAFGVPTLFISGSETPFYGPLIEAVPTGIEAARLWEHVSALAALPYFYELKRTH
ncbi:MAG: DsbA family protein [Anaerolineales bacterium]|jgi:2-hydroxychromene-2-carboxylate isomerase